MLNLVNHQRAVWSAKLLKDAINFGNKHPTLADVDSTGLNNVKIVKHKSAVCLHRARASLSLTAATAEISQLRIPCMSTQLTLHEFL